MQSGALRCTQVHSGAIGCNQTQSDAIRPSGLWSESIGCNQTQSSAIRRNQTVGLVERVEV